MAFRAVSNCLKTGTELVYIGLVMVVPRLGLSDDVIQMGASQIGITEQDPTRLEARRQNDNAAFIARVAYRNPGMAASGMFRREGDRPLLARKAPDDPLVRCRLLGLYAANVGVVPQRLLQTARTV